MSCFSESNAYNTSIKQTISRKEVKLPITRASLIVIFPLCWIPSMIEKLDQNLSSNVIYAALTSKLFPDQPVASDAVMY